MFVISFSTYPVVGVLASDDGKVLGHGSRFILYMYLQAICIWKDSTEKDERVHVVNAPSTPGTWAVLHLTGNSNISRVSRHSSGVIFAFRVPGNISDER